MTATQKAAASDNSTTSTRLACRRCEEVGGAACGGGAVAPSVSAVLAVREAIYARSSTPDRILNDCYLNTI